MRLKSVELINRFKNFNLILFCIILLSLTVLIVHYIPHTVSNSSRSFTPIDLQNIKNLHVIKLKNNSFVGERRNRNCTHYDCFNIYKCGGRGIDRIQVYIYPLVHYIDEDSHSIMSQISLEYHTLLTAIKNSHYYTPNPEEACIFVPSIDTLNQNHFRTKQVSQALAALPFWQNGENHLIFNMVPGAAPDYNTTVDLNIGSALLAGAGFSTFSYRVGFDVSLPVFSPLQHTMQHVSERQHRNIFALSAQALLHKDYERELNVTPGIVRMPMCPDDITMRCYEGRRYPYPQILQNATFCITIRGSRLGQKSILESLAAGCIPVISIDYIVLPFQEVIDWTRMAIIVPEEDMSDIIEKLTSISETRIQELQEHGIFYYSRYFANMEKITQTALDIINYRVYPQHVPSYEDWNIPSYLVGARNPLVLQLTAPRSPGFTAIILTYDRVESLFTLMQQLAKVPSLSKILIVWNNQDKDPPPVSARPKLHIPVDLIRTKENKLSNRFYPYDEIETEAVLSIDDDIIMLTADELEFAFEVWREFPDRIVGFPSRTHIWDNATQQWKYQSEWTNNISMVLTGAAFHHKFWNYMYTVAMPGDVKDWVDKHMNCEDIAMNFLVANYTKKAPIKVTPRKKFKCPECTNNEMLSADLSHMVERSRCINKFAEIYGHMPLLNVEFRADPVLFKDNFPQKLKRFNDIGSL